MKIKYLIIVSLVLAVLTIGAVSAAEDSDALAVEDDAGEITEAPVEEIADKSAENVDKLAQAEADESLAEVDKNDFEVEIKDGTLNTTSNVVDVDWYETISGGNISVFVGENETPSGTWVIEEEEDSAFFNLKELGITQTGNYLINVKFISDEKTIDLASKTISVKEFSKDYFNVTFHDSMVLSLDYYVVVGFEWDSGIEGKFIINVDENEPIEKTITVYDRYEDFTLPNLNIDKTGKYKIKVQYVSDDGEFNFVLVDDNLTVVPYEISASIEDDYISLTSEGDVIELTWDGDLKGTLLIGLNGNSSYRQFSLTEVEEDYYGLNLADLGIEESGKYDIVVRFQSGYDDSISILASGNVTVTDFDIVIEDEDGMSSDTFDFDADVVIRVIQPEGSTDTVKIFVNDEEITLEDAKVTLTQENIKLGNNTVKGILIREGKEDQVINKTFEAVPYMHIEQLGQDDFIYSNSVSTEDEVFYVIELPENAKGKVTLYNGSLDDNDNFIKDSVLDSVMANGTVKIKIPLDKLTPDKTNHVSIVYEDGDYTYFDEDGVSINVYENSPDVIVEIPSNVDNQTDVLIEATVPKGDGIMTVYIDGIETTDSSTDTGVVNFNIGKLANGKHSITLICDYSDENDQYVFYSKTFTIEVGKEAPQPTLNPNLKVGIDVDDFGNVEVTATAEKNATGNVTIAIINATGQTVKNVTGELENGSFVLGDLGFNLNSGFYNFTASYGGDANYTAATAEHSTMLTKNVPTFDAVAHVNEYGFIIVKATINNDATGNVTFRIVREGEDPKPEDDVTVALDNGTAVFGEIKQYAKGNYRIYVTYNGDRTYYMAYQEFLEANINKTYISPNTTQLDVEGGEVNVTVDLGVNATGKVHVVYPSGYVDNVTIENGKVNIYDVFLHETGPISLVLDYDGDNNYYGFYEYYVDFFIKYDSNLTVKADVNDLGLIVIDANVNDTAKGNITFVVYNKTGDVVFNVTKDVVNGAAKFDEVATYPKGNYTYEVYFKSSDDQFEDSEYDIGEPVVINKDYITSTNKLDVTANQVKINLTFPAGATGNLTVFFPSNTNQSIPINSTVVIDEIFENGNQWIQVTYPGDGNYYGYNDLIQFFVKASSFISAKNVNVVYLNSGKVTVTLTDNNDGKGNNPVANASVTITLNGKTYKGTTDAKGIATITIAAKMLPKVYPAKVAFAGTETINGDEYAFKFTVKKATPKLTAKKKTFKAKTKVKKYTVVLKDHKKKAMKKAKVTLKVKGKTYKATTNAKGKAVFKIKNLKKKGTYNAKVTFKATKYFNKVAKTVKIKVKK